MENLKFIELSLSKELLKAIGDMGFEEASPIQSQAIPFILEGKDIIGQSQTGTGKTAAFGIPILEMVDPTNKKTQAIILCPTRELAIQVSEELRKLSKYKHDIKMLPIYGGQPIERQIKALKGGVQIIIGTPGRVMDHMRRRTIKLDNIKMVVLDEADEMLDMGFREDIETILLGVPQERQTVLFSATMPKPIIELTKKFQNNPEHIRVSLKELTVPSIEQFYYEIKEKAKSDVLSRLIDMYDPKLSVVFCNTKKRVDELVLTLQTRGYLAEGLHGDMNQAQRDKVMSKFRKGTIEILVATDVAARGIDVDDVEAVFNYDLPQDDEYYVHRIGRTGRAGRTGRSFTFVSGKKDIYKLKDIQRYTKSKVVLQRVPSLDDVEEIRSSTFLSEVRRAIDEGQLLKYTNYVEKLMNEEYTSIDIAAALIKLALGSQEMQDNIDESDFQIRDFNDRDSQKRDSSRRSSRRDDFKDRDSRRKDSNRRDSKDGASRRKNFTDRDFENTGAKEGMTRLFINIGKNQNVSPKDVVGSITANTDLSGSEIGSIKIFDKYSFVEVPKQHAKDVINIMKDSEIKGKKVNIEPASGR